jgi:hypothetical protein
MVRRAQPPGPLRTAPDAPRLAAGSRAPHEHRPGGAPTVQRAAAPARGPPADVRSPRAVAAPRHSFCSRDRATTGSTGSRASQRTNSRSTSLTLIDGRFGGSRNTSRGPARSTALTPTRTRAIINGRPWLSPISMLRGSSDSAFDCRFPYPRIARLASPALKMPGVFGALGATVRLGPAGSNGVTRAHRAAPRSCRSRPRARRAATGRTELPRCRRGCP